MERYADSLRKDKKVSIDLGKMDSEVIVMMGNPITVLNLFIKYASTYSGEELLYWSRLNHRIAKESNLKAGSITKYLSMFCNYGVMTRVHTGMYSFNKTYIKIK